MDTGVRWDHPEFLLPGVSSFADKNSTRVRDIIIHGASEYGINWSGEGLVAAGSGSLANYDVARVLGSSIPSSSSFARSGRLTKISQPLASLEVKRSRSPLSLSLEVSGSPNPLTSRFARDGRLTKIFKPLASLDMLG